MFQKLVVVIAWSTLLFIAYATLSPIGLRPHLGNVSIERFGAFAAFGLLFGLAYPRHFWLVLVMVLGSAVMLEMLQRITPDRHGMLPDAEVKVFGGLAGVALSFALNHVLRRRSV
ncbi:MAG: VanZ family protein [Tardiphaga sp.]